MDDSESGSADVVLNEESLQVNTDHTSSRCAIRRIRLPCGLLLWPAFLFQLLASFGILRSSEVSASSTDQTEYNAHQLAYYRAVAFFDTDTRHHQHAVVLHCLPTASSSPAALQQQQVVVVWLTHRRDQQQQQQQDQRVIRQLWATASHPSQHSPWPQITS